MSSRNEHSVLDYEPSSLAQHMALIEWAPFSKIEPTDVIKAGRDPQDREENDAISAVILSTNKIARWVAGTILGERNPEKRVSTVGHFISITNDCRKLSNFSSMVSLVSGLNSPPVARLKETWACVGKEHKDALGECRRIIDPIGFEKYQEALRDVQPPCVPFIGAYLMLVGQAPSESQPSDEEIVQQIRKYQGTPYKLERDEGVERFLREQLEKYDAQLSSDDTKFVDTSRELESE